MAARPSYALDVLIQALPSDQANRLAKQLNIALPSTTLDIPTLQSTTTATTSTPTSQSIITATSNTSTSQSKIIVTSASSISTTGTPSSTATIPAAPPVNRGSSLGAVAGIATASAAAIVMVLLVLLYLLRNRRRQSHRRNESQTSLLGGIAGSITKKRMKRKSKVFPEVAWLYDPVRPSSHDQTGRPSKDSIPKMGANAPWSSRPNTSRGNEHGLTALPRSSMAEVSARPGPYMTDSSFRGTQGDDQQRPFYPLRTAIPSSDLGYETTSPLLPPLPRPATRDGREPVRYSPAASNGFAVDLTPDNKPTTTRRPPTRHGPVVAF